MSKSTKQEQRLLAAILFVAAEVRASRGNIDFNTAHQQVFDEWVKHLNEAGIQDEAGEPPIGEA